MINSVQSSQLPYLSIGDYVGMVDSITFDALLQGREDFDLLVRLNNSGCEFFKCFHSGDVLYILEFFPREILASHSLHSALEESCLEIEKNDQISLIWNMEIH